MKKSVIYTDLDGTLLNYENHKSYISDKNKSAVSKWLNDGKYFSIATGRNIRSTSRFIAENKLEYNLPLVLSNGTVVYDARKNKIIYQEVFNPTFIDEAIEYAWNEEKILLVLLSPDNHFLLKPKNEGKLKKPSFYFTEITQEEIDYKNITKISMIVTKELQEEVLEDIKNFKHFSKIELIPSSPTYIEMVNKGTSKLTGIKRALKYTEIHDYQLYTIGDYLNDVPMILGADVGFAPNNAHKDVLNAASIVVSHHNDGAVADMIDIINEMEFNDENN